MLENKKAYWTLIIIEDSAALPGKSIFDIIQLLLIFVNFKFVLLDDIFGAVIPELVETEGDIITIDELLKIICKVKQFDWGDFLLFKQYPENWNFPDVGADYYPELIIQTDTTIRAVDDTYIYIYTPYQEIVKVIKEHYLVESIKSDTLDNLDYPS